MLGPYKGLCSFQFSAISIFQAYGTYSKLLNVSLGVPCHTDYESGVVKRRDHSGIISGGYIMVIWFYASGIIDVLSGCLGTTADFGLVYFNVVHCINMVIFDNKTRGIRGWVGDH